ncbi:response regulator [Thioclava kandeliae]|uniref:Response regulator n=1 Tax=Thioclava kandeliae TaxID=3070818 RepID=A0ABV1SGW2_9RHOB
MGCQTNEHVQKTVLICEDEPIVAMDLEMMVGDMGYRVIGPCASRSEARLMIIKERPDAAILDVQLRDGEVFPLAKRLHECGTRLVFQSGHSRAEEIEDRFPGAIFCEKPVWGHQLEEALRQFLDSEPETDATN